MQILQNKSTAIIALVLVLTIAVTIITAVPVAFGLVSVRPIVATVPKTIGLGDSIYIVGTILPQPPFRNYRYHNVTYTITKPDGTTDIRIIPETNVEGTSSFSYLCNQEGIWKVVLNFPGEYDRAAADSPPASWTVEAGYVQPTIPKTPLPTGPWDYPISAEYYEWYQISGAWLHSPSIMSGTLYNASGTNFNPYTKGPNTAHVLWKKQLTMGGMLGGDQGWLSQISRPPAPVAAQGRVYYTEIAGYGSTMHPRLICLDQYTGEQIYAVDLPGPGYGGTLAFEVSGFLKAGAPEVTNYTTSTAAGIAGAFNLWVMGGGIWQVDPITGRTLYNLPLSYPDVKGNIVTYSYADHAIYLTHYPNYLDLTKWSTITKTIEWTIQPDETMQFQQLSDSPQIRNFGMSGDYLIMPAFLGWNGKPFKIEVFDPTTGDLLVNGTDADYSSTAVGVAAYGNYYIGLEDARVHAYSLLTGQEVWKSEEMGYPWGAYQAYTSSAAYGNVYVGTYDGHLYCFNGETGATEWKYYSGDTTETAFGTFPWWGNAVIGDGKIYCATGEHTLPNPAPRGYKLYCLDAYTGDLVWSYDGFTGDMYSGGISSGMLFYGNKYDGCLYMFGKGESATTVSAPQTTVTAGSSISIEGTVTDQSPGAKGTPAIADEDQNAWMQYLYNNAEIPAATGVPVLLQAVQPDGTVIDIGWVTSDMSGHFHTLWTPPDQSCTYSIVATFTGTESYWPSYAQTAIAVLPAPEAPSEPTEEPAYTTIDLAIIAAVVVVAILVLYTLWSVRKLRK